jgi:putative nucleotidyltransferase with HDIG domain
LAALATTSLRDLHPRDLKGIICEIPTLPVIYQQLFQKMQDPTVSVPQLAEIITRDMSLTAKILHLVNSAFYGYRKQINTIGRAVVILGFRAVRSAALAISVFDYFRSDDTGEKLTLYRFWEHSLATASIAKVLAQQIGFKNTEEAFVVGLLHDIGKLAMHRYFPGDFDEIYAKAQAEDLGWFAAEKELFIINHAIIGKQIFRSWDFPTSVVEAVQYHHNPNAGEQQAQVAALTHLANVIAYEMGHGALESLATAECDLGCLDMVGLTLQGTRALANAFEEEYAKNKTILQLVE